MRIFVDYCRVHDSSRIDAVMPEIQTLATVVQKTFNSLIEDIDNEEREVFIESLGTAKYSKMLIIDQVLHTITLMPIDHYGGVRTSALMSASNECVSWIDTHDVHRTNAGTSITT